MHPAILQLASAVLLMRTMHTVWYCYS